MYFTFIDIFKYGSLRGDFLKISFVFFFLNYYDEYINLNPFFSII